MGLDSIIAAAQAAARQRISNGSIKTYEDLNNLTNSAVSIFPTNVTLTDSQKKQAYQAYSQELLDAYYDTNKDGTVTVDEFAKTEEDSSLKAMQIQADAIGLPASPSDGVIAKRSGSLFATNLDFNANGKIDVNELSFFNENADLLDEYEYEPADGRILNVAESHMFGAVTGMNASDSEINRVVNKYLLGQNLTPDEQATLERATSTIRGNMGRAAGM